MDESITWRARLLKSNINIKYIDHEHGTIYFDFAYRPYSGAPQKWGSSFCDISIGETNSEVTRKITDIVLMLRKELEA